MNHDGKHCDACPIQSCDHRIQKVIMLNLTPVRRSNRKREEKVAAK
jgi:hypothetical protein